MHGNGIEIYSSLLLLRDLSGLWEQYFKVYDHSIKSMYSHKLDEVVDKYSNTCPRIIKIKPVGVQFDTDIEYGIEHKILNSKYVIV